jgi:transcriptional regulator with PAS, ATPase and Fis domain
MPRELIGSELFGYAEGAFTGARKGGKPGKFELASGGTIFLDEIGDMPIDQQGALLRVLQEKKITRIGGLRDIPIDVRVVCATNKDLSDEMRKGNFRSDLFYRLNVINIKIPPLRERPGDILLLFKHFLNDLHAPVDQSFEDIDPEVINCLLRYKWPGNVRELQNVVERMVNAMNGTTIEIENLPMEIREWRPASECPPLPNVSKNQDSDVTMDQARELGKQLSTDMEKNQIIDLLKQYGGNVSRVAREMSISRPTLYKKMRQN